MALEKEMGSAAKSNRTGILDNNLVLCPSFTSAQRKYKPPQQLGVVVPSMENGAGSLHRQSKSKMPAVAHLFSTLTSGGSLSAFFPQNLSMS